MLKIKPLTYKEADSISYTIHELFHRQGYGFCGLVAEIVKVEHGEGSVDITVRLKRGHALLTPDEEHKYVVIIPSKIKKEAEK